MAKISRNVEIRVHLDPPLLSVLAHVVCTQHDPHGGGTVGTVGGGEHPPWIF